MKFIEVNNVIKTTIDLIKLYRFYNKVDKDITMMYDVREIGQYMLDELIFNASTMIDTIKIYDEVIYISVAPNSSIAFCDVLDRRTKR